MCVLPARIRKVDNEAELAGIEDEVDAILRAQLAKSGDREDSASEIHALIGVAHRIDNLVHQRRLLLAARTPAIGEARRHGFPLAT